MLHKIITRMMKALTRRGVLVEEEGSTYMADNDGDSDDARVLRPLQAAACTYRIAFGPRACQKVLTVQSAMPRDAGFKQHLCADIDGFSLHAAVRYGADGRQARIVLSNALFLPHGTPKTARDACESVFGDGRVPLRLVGKAFMGSPNGRRIRRPRSGRCRIPAPGRYG